MIVRISELKVLFELKNFEIFKNNLVGYFFALKYEGNDFWRN